MAKLKNTPPPPMGAPSGGTVPPPPVGLQYFTQPPAPVPVQLPQMFAPQGLQARMPQMDMGFSAANLPDSPPVTAQSAGLKPSDLWGFDNALERARTNADTQREALSKPPDFNFAIPQRSEFDNQLSQALQAKIIENLTGGGDSRMDRFNKGFTMGQKIAAAVVVPALGAFSGNGYAQGFNQSTAQTQAAVAQAEGLQAAEKHQRNNSLAQLASLYEGISPTSSKNITAAVTKQLEMLKMQREMQRQAMNDTIAADNKVADLEHQKLQIMLQGRANQNTAADRDFGNTLALNAAKNSVIRDNQNANNQLVSQGLQAAGLQLQQQGQAFNQKEAGVKNEQWQKTFDQTQAKNQAEQEGKNMARYRQLFGMVNKVDPATGRFLYPEAQKSPAIQAMLQKLQANSGLSEAEINAAQSAMPAMQQAAPEQNPLGELFMGLRNMLPNQQATAPQQSAMPQQQAKPTDFAAIIKAPTQHIQLSQPQIDKMRAGDAKALIGSITQSLTQQLGKAPTDQQIVDAYNALEKAHANIPKRR